MILCGGCVLMCYVRNKTLGGVLLQGNNANGGMWLNTKPSHCYHKHKRIRTSALL